MKSLLPSDWRRRREMPPGMRRFGVEGSRGCWNAIDWAYGAAVSFGTKVDAQGIVRFAYEYVKRHGDIDFGSMPYRLCDELHYDDPEHIRIWWEEDYPPRPE